MPSHIRKHSNELINFGNSILVDFIFLNLPKGYIFSLTKGVL
jgi:hypothetical protein